jgi:hypothetical protein
LAVGSWQLAVGSWQLAVGKISLAIVLKQNIEELRKKIILWLRKKQI